jgi:S-adenosyl-L-methionine hydrolase (adenosine-forming)
LGLITLITDLGHKDFYVASVKAAILGQAPHAQIIDISHEVKAFDIYEAAFLLRAVWMQFPIGTVHVIGINPELTPDQPHLVVHYMGHYFISADNGVFGQIFDEVAEDIYEIELPQGNDWVFPLKGVFATAAAHLSKGGVPEILGRRTQGFKKTMRHIPTLDHDHIIGKVIYIDGYRNVYTNITKALFNQEHRGRNYHIVMNRSRWNIRKISRYYTDVPEGERLAMWATNGHLMIAVNGGVQGHGNGAAELFGLENGSPIRIEFYDHPNRQNDL